MTAFIGTSIFRPPSLHFIEQGSSAKAPLTIHSAKTPLPTEARTSGNLPRKARSVRYVFRSRLLGSSIPQISADPSYSRRIDTGILAIFVFPFDSRRRVTRWPPAKVAAWIESLNKNFSGYGQIFIKNEIDGPALLELTDDKLKKLGITTDAHRWGIAYRIKELREINLVPA
mmetsp:Transcript_14107/g.23532  ORF Transcript_14107/g.23532 Transcript_14107/m.23532 type:complete len:172 (+) Transcript_14107:342-857(+)